MAPRPAEIYVAVGSNIEPERNIPEAVLRLQESAGSIAVSTFYRTKPLERPQQADFRNGVVRLDVQMERERVERDLLKPIEAGLGRVRTEDKHAARTIDLDLAVYCEDGRVTWVDAEALQRNFIAVPLAELSPGLPLRGEETAAQIAAALGTAGLEPDTALTRKVKELANHE